MIPVSAPSLGELERKYLLDAFDSGWISSRGSYIARAEIMLKEITESKHALVVSSGTTALHVGLLALGIGAGDEVILPSFSYAATLNAVLYVNAVPIIVDVDPETWCISPEAVEEAITNRSRAILAVDIYGCPADYSRLSPLASEHGLKLVADAAESIGARVGNKAVGSLADVSTFSFFGNKVITSGEGGAVTTSDAAVDKRARQLSNQGNHPEIRYFHDVLGYNYRMTNLSAAILCAQLERLDELMSLRRVVIDWYGNQLSHVEGLTSQKHPDNSEPTPWMYTTLVEGFTAEQRDALIEFLATEGIEARPVFHPMQNMPYFTPASRLSTPVADRIGRTGISLPTYPDLTEEQVHQICTTLLKGLDKVR